MKNLVRKLLPLNRYHSLARWWQYLRNIGLKHKCLVCGKSVCCFLPFGSPPRPSAMCPFCESLERHRSLWLFLKSRTDLFSRKMTLLHLAPELCFRSQLSKLPTIHYVSGDLKANGVSAKLDVQNLPFKDNTFDCVLCSHVLEHVNDDLKAMREILRVMKSGAWAVLQVPLDANRSATYEDPMISDPDDRQKIFGQWDHVRVYGIDYGKRLAESGFIVRPQRFIKELPERLITLYGLENEDIWMVYKPPATR